MSENDTNKPQKVNDDQMALVHFLTILLLTMTIQFHAIHEIQAILPSE